MWFSPTVRPLVRQVYAVAATMVYAGRRAKLWNWPQDRLSPSPALNKMRVHHILIAELVQHRDFAVDASMHANPGRSSGGKNVAVLADGALS